MTAWPLVRAAPLDLPANAIAADTFFVAKLDPAKIDPANVEATVKAALAENAADADALLNGFKATHEKFSDKGVQALTLVARGEPTEGRPRLILYAKMKPDADRPAFEQFVRGELGEAKADSVEITSDGDFMLLRERGVDAPGDASDERRRLFEEALGESEKPAVAALIFTESLSAQVVSQMQRGLAYGADLLDNAKWFRFELALGTEPRIDITIHAADAEGAKKVVDGINGVADAMKKLAAQLKQAANPQVAKSVEAMETLADGLKPEQADANVRIRLDAKVIGVMVSGMMDLHDTAAGSSGN